MKSERFDEVKHLDIKKPPDYGQEAIQMFSQRNNPYCELLFKFWYNISEIFLITQ